MPSLLVLALGAFLVAALPPEVAGTPLQESLETNPLDARNDLTALQQTTPTESHAAGSVPVPDSAAETQAVVVVQPLAADNNDGSKVNPNSSMTSHKANPHMIVNSPISSLLGTSASMPLNPLRILTAPLRNLVLLSFEGYRRLIRNAERIEDSIRRSLGLSKRVRLRSLDPLDLPEPVALEHRDRNIPILGKLVFTMSDISVSGLSNFRVEELDGLGRNLHFQHLIPHLDSIANYTIDYHLFDVIPFRVSEGSLVARVPNARVRGSFQMFPDLVNVWFRVAQLNLTTWVEDLDIHFYPRFLLSDRFAIDRSTVDKIHTAFNYFLPNVTELLKVTYTKAIEMRLV